MNKECSIDIFTKNLKMYKEQFEKNQKEVAAIVGVSPPTVHDWLKGKKMPRMNNVQKLADYFGVKLSDLIEEKVTPTIEKNSDTMVDITVRLGADVDFRDIVKRNYYDRDFFELYNMLCGLSNEQLVQKIKYKKQKELPPKGGSPFCSCAVVV